LPENNTTIFKNGNQVKLGSAMKELPKIYGVSIGKLLVIWFEKQEYAEAFIAGFNYGRRQKEPIHYEFKDPFKTRGFAYSWHVRHFLKIHDMTNNWRVYRASLTIHTGDDTNKSGDATTSPP
jgi:hypothetical protein